MSRAILGNEGRNYALCGNFDDIVRVVGGEKGSRRRKGTVMKDGELGPRVLEESFSHGTDFPAEVRR